MATDRMIAEWTDLAGGFLRTANWVDSGGGIATLQAAMEPLSNARMTFNTVGAPRAGSNTPASGTWYLTTDTVVLLFNCADGTPVSLVIPAPKQAIFASGGLLVNAAQTDVAALIAAATGTLANVADSTVVAFVSGVKSSRRVEQNAPPS